MDIILENFVWMAFNISLALIAVFSGWLFLTVKNRFLKVLLFFIWLIFMPNTIYIFTDLLHIPDEWQRLENLGRVVMTIQFLILEIAGFVSFVIGLLPFERMLKNYKFKKYEIIIAIILFNFLIAFGVVLGRIQRLNSWEIFTNTEKVISDSLKVLSSTDMLLVVVFFGILGCYLYFLFKDVVQVKLKQFFGKDIFLT